MLGLPPSTSTNMVLRGIEQCLKGESFSFSAGNNQKVHSHPAAVGSNAENNQRNQQGSSSGFWAGGNHGGVRASVDW